MSNTKMVIVVRSDLNMPKGKMVAQVGHGVQYCIRDIIYRTLTRPAIEWLNDESSTKIGLKVKSEQELDDLKAKAKAAGIKTHMVVDNGVTMFEGVETKTCLILGPDYNEKFVGVTDGLSLL